MTWQPIDIAPKDGTSILGYRENEIIVVHWCTILTGIGYWSLTVCNAPAWDSEWFPTHWQPLPAAPGLFENTTLEALDD